MSGQSLVRRSAWIVSGLIVFALWMLLSGGGKSIILINFGIDAAYLEGTEVVIDGEVAGTLKRMGARAESGFQVKDGDHTVELRHPDLPGSPATVTTGFGGDKVMLIADFQTMGRGGDSETHLVLMR